MQVKNDIYGDLPGHAPAMCSAVLVASLCLNMPINATVAVGDVANEIDNDLRSLDVGRSSSYVLSSVARMKSAIEDLTREYCNSNWNGYGESPISADSCNYALRFVELLPIGGMVAEALVDADGEVVLEWYKCADEFLSLTFSKAGVVHCLFRQGNSQCSDIFDMCDDDDLEVVRKYVSRIA